MKATRGRTSPLGAVYNTPSVGQRVGRSLRRKGSKAASTGLPKAKGAASAIGRTAKAAGRAAKTGAKGAGGMAKRAAVGGAIGHAMPGMDAMQGAQLAAMGGPMGQKLIRKMFF